MSNYSVVPPQKRHTQIPEPQLCNNEYNIHCRVESTKSFNSLQRQNISRGLERALDVGYVMKVRTSRADVCGDSCGT